MVLLAEEAQVEGWLVCLEIVLILMQDYTVRIKRTICSEFNLDAPDRTPS